MRDEDIQVWWGQLVFRFILGVGVCAFPDVPGMEKSKKNCRPPEDNFWNSPHAFADDNGWPTLNKVLVQSVA